MKERNFVRVMAALTVLSICTAAKANSFGFEQAAVTTASDQFSVSFGYDFTEFAMFGGAVDIVYDPTEIQLDSLIFANLPIDAMHLGPASDTELEPGLISGVGVGTLNFFDGINSASRIGTLSFTILGSGTGNTPCGATLCITTSAINPFVSLAGLEVSDEILGQGITSFEVTQVPLPGAIWLMLSCVGAIIGFGRAR